MFTISEIISKVKKKSALIPFITAGYPNLQVTKELIYQLDKNGANVIELGIPYSDALADGIVIQESSRIALEQKTYINEVITIVKQVSPYIVTPIIIFTYYNPILCRGLDTFIQELAESGVKGLVIPDLPLEEADYLIDLCSYYSIELILFVSPTSSEKRINAIISKAPGCIYLVSSCGVTGMKESIDTCIEQLVVFIKERTNKHIMLGFGISDAKQVSDLMDMNMNIDAIVMGSAFINKINDCSVSGNYNDFGFFCKEIDLAIGNK